MGLLVHSASAVEIVCHRAANEYAPENTRAAAQVALGWGVDYIEVDVRTSKDGVMYILHDPTVDRTTNGHGTIHRLTSREIDALDAGRRSDPKFAGEKVPRLKPYLEWIKGKAKVYFDVKVADPKKLVKLIHRLGLEKDCFLWSGNPALMKALRKQAPDLPLKVNASTPDQVEKAKQEYNARIVEFGAGDITPELLETCRRLGIKSMVMETRKDADVFRKILDAHVDMVNLDHADLFIKIRNEMAAKRLGN
jgi:glycerophosphoryl diester phosphodiesterase